MTSIHFIKHKAVKSRLRLGGVGVVLEDHAGRVGPRIQVRLNGRSPEHQLISMTPAEASELSTQLVNAILDPKAKG